MNCHPSRNSNHILPFSHMSPRVYLPLHSRRTHRSNISQLIYRYYSARYILRSRSFSLCPIYRSSIRNHSRNHSLIPLIFRNNHKPHLIENPIPFNIYWSKYYIFSSTFLRTKRNTSTILRLSRQFHIMKYSFQSRFHSLLPLRTNYSLHSLRISNQYTPNPIFTPTIHIIRMISSLPPSRT